MMEIFGMLITSVLGGGATGLLGVLLQRFFDFKNRQQDIEIVKLNLANSLELSKIESERERYIAETRANADMYEAQQETYAREAEADSKSMVASFEHDEAKYLDKVSQRRKGWVGAFSTILMGTVDFVRGILRPGMTIYLCYVVMQMFTWSKQLADQFGMQLTSDQVMQIIIQIIATILYVFTTAALWWFGTRPPKKHGDK